MGGKVDLVTALFIPAGIALILYVVLFFFIVPAIKRYRSRYDQYLPVQAVTERVAAGTSSIGRIGNVLMSFILPRVRSRMVVQAGRNDSGDDLYGLEEGEEMDDFLEQEELDDVVSER